MQKPKVVVLLAAYDAKKWFIPQLTTLLSQEGCDLLLYISLDSSNDGSEEWLPEIVAGYDNIHLLPMNRRFGSAAKNFYHLVREVDLSEADYVAFCDQDDLWKANKLKRAIAKLQEEKASGYSSNVLAYWSDDETKLIKKDYPQTNIDHFFESAGPGCTYVVPQNEFLSFQKMVREQADLIDKIDFHDWLIYAFIRGQDKKWCIDHYEGMFYRQHGQNVIGARSGVKAIRSRFSKIMNGWYREQILLILEVLALTHSDLYQRIKRNHWNDRFYLLRYMTDFRRKRSDSLILAILIVLNLW